MTAPLDRCPVCRREGVDLDDGKDNWCICEADGVKWWTGWHYPEDSDRSAAGVEERVSARAVLTILREVKA